MTNLTLETLDMRVYLAQLVELVRKEKDRVQGRVVGDDRVSCVIEHTVTFTAEGPVEKAQLKYGLSRFVEGKMLPPNYEIKDLVDGNDYNYAVVTDLIQAAAADCNMAIDMFAMNSDVMYSDDITGRVQNFVTGALESVGIEEGYTVSTIPVSGGISQITITVA